MDHSIRPFEQKDLMFLWEMLYQSIYVPEGQQAPSQAILKEPSIEKYLKNWGKLHDHALIAVDSEDHPIGAIWIRLFDRDHAGYGFVDDATPELGMALLPPYRGQGIGGALLSAMSDVVRSVGFSAVSLSVDPNNKAALGLYEKNGYVKVYQDDGGSQTMKKIL